MFHYTVDIISNGILRGEMPGVIQFARSDKGELPSFTCCCVKLAFITTTTTISNETAAEDDDAELVTAALHKLQCGCCVVVSQEGKERMFLHE